MSLNLAQKPFVNWRPVRRVGYLLWIAGLLLAVLNGFLYWDYLSGQGVTETGLQEVMGQLDEESRLLESARARLAGLETEELNSKVEFVNLRIQQRTFSWSRLFDVFAATLPDDVRLSTLTPKFEDARGRSRSRTTDLRSDAVQLEIRGQAKSSKALLEFLDRLFAHAAFDDPDLHREQARRDQEIIEFSISTSYRPDIVDLATPEGSGTQEATE
ncbi:MAG: PilN domain-containing protein [Myxococcota bacterium]